MATIFLLVGVGSDGPTNIPYRPNSLRELKTMIGGEYIERQYITSAASSTTLLYPAYKTPLNEVESRKQYLYYPNIDNATKQTLTFGNIGGSGLHQVDFTYQPYLGKSDLYLAAKRYLEFTGSMPYILRLGGTYATLSSNGWEFESKYPGQKYNNLVITSNGSSISVSGMEPNYPVNTYAETSVDALVRYISNNYDLGMSPINCIKAGSAILPTGTYSFSGGSDGTLTDSDIDFFFSNFSLPIDINHVLLLTEITSSIVFSIEKTFEDGQQPRMFFVPSLTYFGTGSAQPYINAYDTAVPYKHNMLSCFVGEVTIDYNGGIVNRYAAEAATIAYAKTESVNITNLPVDAKSFVPSLTEENLNLLKGAGLVPLNRYIKNDIAVYEGTTTYAESTFLFSSVLANICSISYGYCFKFLGQSILNGPQLTIAEQLRIRLSNLNFVTIDYVEVDKEGENLYVNIEGKIASEILSISFTVQNTYPSI